MLNNIIPDAVNFCSANSSFKAEKEGKKGYFGEEKTLHDPHTHIIVGILEVFWPKRTALTYNFGQVMFSSGSSMISGFTADLRYPLGK